MKLDGKKQRNALTAAEQSLRALAGGDGERASRSAIRAAELDQIGAYAALPEVVADAADSLADGAPSEAAWERVANAVGPGPLGALVEQLRS